MGRPLRHHPANKRPLLIEATCETIQGRPLLRPSPKVTSIILGIIGRALAIYTNIKLIDFTILSNEYKLLLTAKDEQALALFMGYVNSLLARKVAAKIHNWNTKTWAYRYLSASVMGAQSMISRARATYALAVTQNLVGSPELWPGASSIRARLFDEKLVGKWYDETAIYRQRRRGIDVDPEDHATTYTIELAPLPPWANLPPDHYRKKISDLVFDITLEANARLQPNAPIGAQAVLNQNPWTPTRNARTLRPPPCYASPPLTDQYLRSLAAFHRRYNPASKRFRAGDLLVPFPPFCFRPPAPLVHQHYDTGLPSG